MRRSLAPSVRRLSGRFKAARSDSADSTSEKKIRKCEIGSKENAQDLVEMDRLTNEHDAFVRQLLSKPFKLPLRGDYNGETGIRSLGIRRSMGRRPLHDPMAENALVLYEPPPLTAEQNLRINKEDTLVHVVVDPILSNFLRPHQREGVKFMYECVTGLRVPNNFGCIMADEMGLGKTLQCISLLWTLLKQGPEAKPIVQKAVVVSPSSLVKNWADEIDKWLKGQLQALKIDGGCRGDVEKKLAQFVSSTNRQRGAESVLIISYETFRAHAEILCRSNECIGLLMCDEGHRLKNMENQTYCAINGLPCKRRVLLSGTPIQNDLLEYFSLVNFVNCGLLGSAGDFRKQFEIPILAARDANSTDTEQKTGQTKLTELTGIVNRCLIRRTQALLIKYLPTKYTFVVCCRLTEIQQKLYRSLIQKLMPSSLMIIGRCYDHGLDNSSVKRNKQAPPRKLCILLSFITILKNLCNHPQLISDKINDMDEEVEYLNACLSSSKHKGALSFNPALSGKMIVLDRLLAVIRSTTNDNVVLISNYTQTLDLFERLCEMRNYRSVRLDGSMTIKGRGRIVNEFNNPASGIFAFILSSKAGGCGLNLIGANRLIMFDPDWNPANDEQAMARVWRDGQKKNCFVYRFVCTGTLEEKIIQRQAHKLALSNCVVDEADDVQRHFSKDELKDLFSLADRSVLDTNTSSSTHETFKCRRCVNGVQVTEPSFSENTSSSDLSTWSHCWTKKTISDSVLKKAWSDDLISFVFANRSHEQIKTA